MHQDMLGQPLEVGDIIAWAVGSGSRAVGMSVGRVERITDTGKLTGYGPGFKTWWIKAMPIKSSHPRHYYSDKAVTIKKVGNVLRLGTDLDTLKETLDDIG